MDQVESVRDLTKEQEDPVIDPLQLVSGEQVKQKEEADNDDGINNGGRTDHDYFRHKAKQQQKNLCRLCLALSLIDMIENDAGKKQVAETQERDGIKKQIGSPVRAEKRYP